MPNINPPPLLWLFDLDNTLHNASHAIFPAISANMNAVIARALGDGTTPASKAEVDAARVGYWKRYGVTMVGMVKHHNVRADDFLRETHTLDNLPGMIRFERGLSRMLRQLPGRKVLLTNAPNRYSRDVMRHMGVARHFSHHLALEDMRVHGELRPKPSKLMLQRLLRRHGVPAHRAVLVEDTLANLRSAKSLGIRTAWVTGYLRIPDPIVGSGKVHKTLNRPTYVDVKVKSVRQLRKRVHHLRAG